MHNNTDQSVIMVEREPSVDDVTAVPTSGAAATPVQPGQALPLSTNGSAGPVTGAVPRSGAAARPGASNPVVKRGSPPDPPVVVDAVVVPAVAGPAVHPVVPVPPTVPAGLPGADGPRLAERSVAFQQARNICRSLMNETGGAGRPSTNFTGAPDLVMTNRSGVDLNDEQVVLTLCSRQGRLEREVQDRARRSRVMMHTILCFLALLLVIILGGITLVILARIGLF